MVTICRTGRFTPGSAADGAKNNLFAECGLHRLQYAGILCPGGEGSIRRRAVTGGEVCPSCPRRRAGICEIHRQVIGRRKIAAFAIAAADAFLTRNPAEGGGRLPAGRRGSDGPGRRGRREGDRDRQAGRHQAGHSNSARRETRHRRIRRPGHGSPPDGGCVRGYGALACGHR